MSYKENWPYQFQQDSNYKIYIMSIRIIGLFYWKKLNIRIFSCYSQYTR